MTSFLVEERAAVVELDPATLRLEPHSLSAEDQLDPLSAYQPVGLKATSSSESSPSRCSLESGGRSYGLSGSPQTILIGPS